MMLQAAILLSVVGLSLQQGLFLNGAVPHEAPTSGTDQTGSGSSASSGTWQKPAFCHDLDCPKYTVMETNSNYELRRYEPSIWVATMKVAMLYTKADNTEMFFKLFHYISGNNTQNMKIAMTAPVVTEVVHGPGPDCESNFTMHFMIPFDLQSNPPQPTEDGVFIRYVPEMTFYVKQYGGFSTDDIKRQKLEELTNGLNAANKVYRDDMFFTAGYDGPYAFVRHNEIWVVAQ